MRKTVSEDSIRLEGSVAGSAFPEDAAETTKALVLNGIAEPFSVYGAAYGERIVGIGPGIVHGPALAGAEIRLEVGAPARQHWLGGVRAAASIVARPAEQDQAAVCTSLADLRFVIRGDLIAGERIELEHTLVVGSVTAPRIRLRNSVVLGEISARGDGNGLHAICSAFGLYDVGSLTLEGPTTIVVAGGASDRAPEFLPHAAEGSEGREYPFSMRSLALCRDGSIGCGVPPTREEHRQRTDAAGEGFDATSGTLCRHWLFGSCSLSDGVGHAASDYLRLFIKPGSEGSSPIGRNGDAPGAVGRWFFGLQNRIVDWHSVEHANREFNRLLHRAMAFDHLDAAARARFHEDLASGVVAPQEAALLALAVEGV